MARNGVETLPSDSDGALHGVGHPNLGYQNHERKTNGAAVLGGMMAIVEKEIRRREAYFNKINDVSGCEKSALVKVFIMCE